MKKVLLIVPTVFLLVSVLFNIVSFASTGTVGSELYVINQKTIRLQEENKKLAQELSAKESLQSLLEQAKAAGFVPISQLTQVDPKSTQVALDVHATLQ